MRKNKKLSRSSWRSFSRFVSRKMGCICGGLGRMGGWGLMMGIVLIISLRKWSFLDRILLMLLVDTTQHWLLMTKEKYTPGGEIIKDNWEEKK